MTEWWVSQKKHWCDICRVWTGGHIQQINKHKAGRMHIEHEEKMLKDARIREQEREKEKTALEKQLADIEKAALAAMAKDFPGYGGNQPAAGCSGNGGGGGGTQGGSKDGFAQMMQRGRDVEMAMQKHAILQTVNSSPAVAAAAAAEEAAAAAIKAADVDTYSGCPWTRHKDPNSGCFYYYNASTGVSSWTETPEFAAARTAASTAAATAARAKAMAAATPPPPPPQPAAPAARQVQPPGWGTASSSTGAPPAKIPRTDAGPVVAVEAPAASAAPGSATPATASAAPVAQAAPASDWVTCTDPNSGTVFYHNKKTKESSWTQPLEMLVDVSKAPPPPTMKKPPGPPAKKKANDVGVVGMWEEVKPEESMWRAGEVEEAPAAEEGIVGTAPDMAPDSDEEPNNPMAELRHSLGGRKGMWADEDLELRPKEMFNKKSNS
mmetsp:Transcript_15542/g.33745  ORF Transcript_15542/g.33745 Transcript_15542/m.33745 type:complete len:437 (+) Transcript_15542:77-1387(+)